MNALSLTTASNVLSDSRVDTLAGVRVTDEAAIEHVATEFEAVFISLLLKEMRNTIGDEGMFGGDTSGVYGGLFDLYMGQHMAQNAELGIGKLIKEYANASADGIDHGNI